MKQKQATNQSYMKQVQNIVDTVLFYNKCITLRKMLSDDFQSSEEDSSSSLFSESELSDISESSEVSEEESFDISKDSERKAMAPS